MINILKSLHLKLSEAEIQDILKRLDVCEEGLI
jgi:hypothetical protein